VYFIPQKIPRYKRGHGRQVKRRAGTMNVLTEAITLLRKFETSKTEFYKSLVSYKKSFVTSLVQNINSKGTFFDKIIQSFLYNKNNSLDDQKPQTLNENRETIMIPFVSKALDHFKLKSIFLDTRIQKLLPQEVHKNLPLSVRFSYNLPMGRKIFNYNSFLNKLDNQQIHDILNSDCECQNSEFLYKNHGHIITGDLSLVKNKTLCKLMTKGTKFREPILTNHTELTNAVTAAMANFTEKLSKQHDIMNSKFDNWKKEVCSVFNSRLEFLKKHKPWLFKDTDSVLEKYEIKSCLKTCKIDLLFVT
jgi:hypothetical protein